MKFSVVIPVYNVKDYLEKCVDSVLAQTGADYEILLVDDGSTDGVCPEICDRYGREYPDRIRVIHQENGGLGAARNTGIEAAQGEYLVFIDSDDYILPGLLEDVSAALAEHPCDIIDFGFQVVREDGTVTETHAGELPSGCVLSLSEYPQMLLVLPSAWRRVYRRSLFLNTGIRYPSRVWYEDIRTTLKLFAAADGVVSIPKPYYAYLVREGSITRNSNVKRNAEILEAFDDLRSWFTQQGLWEAYHAEFTRLAVDHILLAASVRVIRIDPKSELIETFRSYMDDQFPDWKSCPLLESLPKQHKLILKLLDGKHYRMIRSLFAIKDGLS